MNGTRLPRHPSDQCIRRATLLPVTAFVPRGALIKESGNNNSGNAHEDVDQGRVSEVLDRVLASSAVFFFFFFWEILFLVPIRADEARSYRGHRI